MRSDARRIIDAHVHLFNTSEINRLAEIARQEKFLALNVACVPSGLDTFSGLHYNFVSFLFKALFPETTYLFGGLDHFHRLAGSPERHTSFAEQARALVAMGADGIKMLEGKPHDRRKLGEPLDSPTFDDFYDWMQRSATPILFHVADPVDFWDPRRVPSWAREAGWCYAEGGFPSWEQLQTETAGILHKYPRLTIIFAHFLFLSHDIDRAARFLDRWENVCFDLTPGVEMYFDFARKRTAWREFFTHFQDRIIFGTDRTAQEQTLPIGVLRKFLETDQPSFGGKGLDLDDSVLRKIYTENIRRAAGHRPRRLNMAGVIEACRMRREDLQSAGPSSASINELSEVERRLLQLISR